MVYITDQYVQKGGFAVLLPCVGCVYYIRLFYLLEIDEEADTEALKHFALL